MFTEQFMRAVTAILKKESHVQVSWILWEVFFKKIEIWAKSMGSDAIALNFSKELDSTECSMRVLESLDF